MTEVSSSVISVHKVILRSDVVEVIDKEIIDSRGLREADNLMVKDAASLG